MLDLKLIRDEPDTVDAALKRRGLDAVSANVLSLDSERRDLQTRMQDLQQQRNQASKAIGDAKRKGEDASEAM